jgi:hypothetical protein
LGVNSIANTESNSEICLILIALSSLIQVIWKGQIIFDKNPFAVIWGKENFVGIAGLVKIKLPVIFSNQ